MKLSIENSEARRLIEANCNLAISIAQLAEYIESDSLNKFGLVEIIKSLRDNTFVITSGLRNNIAEADEKKDLVELTWIAAALNELSAKKFGYCCSEKDSLSCFKSSTVALVTSHKDRGVEFDLAIRDLANFAESELMLSLTAERTISRKTHVSK